MDLPTESGFRRTSKKSLHLRSLSNNWDESSMALQMGGVCLPTSETKNKQHKAQHAHEILKKHIPK